MDVNQLAINSEAKEDRINKTKTIYEASGWEIFWRNFLAGLSRGLGFIFVYFLVISVLGFFMAQYVWPQIAPILEDIAKVLPSTQGMTSFPR